MGNQFMKTAFEYGILAAVIALLKYYNEKRVTVEVPARALNITWGSNADYWRYTFDTLGGKRVTVAKLLDVCWLNVEGVMDVTNLTPSTEYNVLFVVKVCTDARGFSSPVTCTLTTPNGFKVESQKRMDNIKGAGWTELSAGGFRTPPPGAHGLRRIKLRLHEHGGHWKSGLIIGRVVIRPYGAP